MMCDTQMQQYPAVDVSSASPRTGAALAPVADAAAVAVADADVTPQNLPVVVPLHPEVHGAAAQPLAAPNQVFRAPCTRLYFYQCH